MKKFLCLFAFAAALFAPEIQAQSLISTGDGLIIYTNAATTNLATPLFLDCRRQKDVALSLTWKLNGAGTDVSSFHFKRALDAAGTYSEGTAAYVFQKASAGATGATIATNITMNGFPYFVMTLASNATAGADMTNVVIRYFSKPNSP